MTAIFCTLLISCPSNTGSRHENGGKQIKICLLGADPSRTWNIWAWTDSGNLSSVDWPGNLTLDKTDLAYGYVYRTLTVNPDVDLNYLWVDSSGANQTGDRKCESKYLQENDTLYFLYQSDTVYTSIENMLGMHGASITSADGNTVVVEFFDASEIKKEDFIVKGKNGTSFSVQSANLSGSKVTLTLSDGNISEQPYSVTHNGKTVPASITSDLIDSVALYDGDDLGISFTDKTSVTFKTWAPTALDVSLLLFKNSTNLSVADKTVKMESMDKGIWEATQNCSDYNYYKYRINTGSATYDVCDIWAKSASPDSIAAQITDINSDANAQPTTGQEKFDGTKENYENPFGENGSVTKSYTDAVIYEMHIRDWSRAVNGKSTGKFEEFSDDKIIEHLKELGITHVQILPMFDYAQTNADTSYNWGYNPYHYNVPEGRYVKDMKDGTDAVKQAREMIQKLHDVGIAVIMDVVYNHTSGTGTGSLYDMTVPKYFYRLNGDGNYSNGSGCGNEVATNHGMVKKYVIDSLKHWMLDYHINGFRFDLMGLHETDTMREIYKELSAIDKNVMVYGEPWTGGSSTVRNGVSRNNIKDCADTTYSQNGVGCFDDSFRDAVKGASTNATEKGFVNGNPSGKSDSVIAALKGSTDLAGVIGRFINYAECHDNYTLFDKLCDVQLGKAYTGDMLSAIGDNGLKIVKQQDILTAAFIILAQGTPFINGGQEFMRTKKGNPDSYASDTKGGKFWSETEINECNTIDLTMKEKFKDVYNAYKGLIALRVSDPESFGNNNKAKAESLSTTGVMRYQTGDYIVWFNVSSSDYKISDGDKASDYLTQIDVLSGSVKENKLQDALSSVPAKSFVILRK